jgi:hypothetical protein
MNVIEIEPLKTTLFYYETQSDAKGYLSVLKKAT